MGLGGHLGQHCRRQRVYTRTRDPRTNGCLHTKKTITEHKNAPPWVTDNVLCLVAKKMATQSPGSQAAADAACSRGIIEEKQDALVRAKRELAEVKRGSRAWWRKTSEMTHSSQKVQSSIPSLKTDAGEWALDAVSKAEVLASTLFAKYKLPGIVENEYSTLVPQESTVQTLPCPEILYCSVQAAERHLQQLREDSATGPDLLPSRVLKYCASQLALAVAMLATKILHWGHWPDAWLEHWLVPFLKRGSASLPGNYRGIHLSSQLSKVVERLILETLEPFLPPRGIRYGPHQFAYCKGRGARDALLYIVLWWLDAFNFGSRHFGSRHFCSRHFCSLCSPPAAQ